MKRISPYAVFSLCFFVNTVLGNSAREQEWAERFHAQAMQQVEQNVYDVGLANFRAACRWRNDSASYWNDLGVTEMRMGLYRLAKKRFLKALRIDSSFDLARKNLEELKHFMPGDPDWQSQNALISYQSHNTVTPKILSHENFFLLDTALSDYAQNTQMHEFVSSTLSTPFIVQNAFELLNITDARLEAVLNRKFLTTRYGHERVDFYPQNMREESAHPYFLNFGSALYQLLNKPEEVYVGVDASEPGTYIQWNLDYQRWNEIVQELGATLPGMLNDSYWAKQCFRHHHTNKPNNKEYEGDNQNEAAVDAAGDTVTTTLHNRKTSDISTDTETSSPAIDIRSQFYLSTHWQMVLIGEDQAGMFNHMDTLRTASWQLQLFNSKKWHLCSPEMTPFLYNTGEVDMFNVDYSVHPLVLNASCYEVTLQPGDLLYYPADYWHQTLNIGTPSIALSGTLVTPLNYELVTEELRKECTNDGMHRIFAYDRKMCDMLEQCYSHWSNIFSEE